jgi:cell division protein FtsQ
MDKRRWKNVLYKLLIVLFFSGFGAMVVIASGFTEIAATPSLRITIDHSSGHSFIREEDVESLVKSSLFALSKVDAATLRKLERYLEANPFIKKAEAFVNSKGQLHLMIQQRAPVARVLPKQGANFYIDEEGKKFPLSKNYTAKVPLITGWVNEPFRKVDTIHSALLKEAFFVISYAAADSFWSAQVAQVHIAEDESLILLPRMGEHTILLGRGEDLEHKFRNLDLFYKYVLDNKGWDQYKTINLQFKNQIVCK